MEQRVPVRSCVEQRVLIVQRYHAWTTGFKVTSGGGLTPRCPREGLGRGRGFACSVRERGHFGAIFTRDTLARTFYTVDDTTSIDETQ